MKIYYSFVKFYIFVIDNAQNLCQNYKKIGLILRNTTKMVDENLVQINTKARGTKELRERMKYGDIGRIAKAFNSDYINTYNVILGKASGDKRVLDCALEIAAFYEEVNLEGRINEIIQKHATANEN